MPFCLMHFIESVWFIYWYSIKCATSWGGSAYYPHCYSKLVIQGPVFRYRYQCMQFVWYHESWRHEQSAATKLSFDPAAAGLGIGYKGNSKDNSQMMKHYDNWLSCNSSWQQ